MEKELNINGAIYRLVEEESKLEVGRWYKRTAVKDTYAYKVNSTKDDCNFGFWYGEWRIDLYVCMEEYWKPADMKEVEKLLISEAEKRGYKNNTEIKSLFTLGFKSALVVGSNTRIDSRGFWYMGCLLLDFQTGKWAEIINKPLYTNQYGTEFFEGDKVWFISSRDGEIVESNIDALDDRFGESNLWSEIMTEKECYRYIYENYEKLKNGN